MAHDWNHEPVRRLRRHAKMDRAEALNDVVIVVIVGIDLGEVGDRLDDREHEERQQGQFRARLGRTGVEGSAQFLQCGDVGFLDIGKMRNAAGGLGHVVGDTPAQADDLDGLDRLIGGPARSFRRRLGRAGDKGVEIVVGDASRRSGAAHETQIDACFAGLQAHRGRRERLLARRTRRRSLRLRRAQRRRNVMLRRCAERRLGSWLRGRGDRLRPDARRGRGLLQSQTRFWRGSSQGIRLSRRIDANELGADCEHVADRAAEREHAARDRGRDFDRRLVGHHRGDNLILLDEIADLDRPLDDFRFRDSLADVGHLDRAHAHLRSPSL